MDPGDDAYKILGVPETASSTEIRTAYRKLALRHHPDKHTTTEAKETATKMFAKVSNAYEILSDLEQKQEYDALRQRQRQQPQEEHFHYGQPSHSAGRASSTTSHRIDDLFQNFFSVIISRKTSNSFKMIRSVVPVRLMPQRLVDVVLAGGHLLAVHFTLPSLDPILIPLLIHSLEVLE